MPHYIASNLITEVSNIISPGSTVLEIGTGEGTKALVDFNVISIEHNPKWHTGHSKLIHVPLVEVAKLNLPNSFEKRFPDASYWYNPTTLTKALTGIQYDAILIDGPNGGAKRAAMWWFYDKLFNIEVPVIVDDVHRQYDWLVATKIARVKNVKSFSVYLAEGNKKDNNMFTVII